MITHPILDTLPPELLELRPVYDDAPRPISPREAATIAAQEYAYARRGNKWICLSGGSDGGMHYRDDAYSEAAARGWAEERQRGLVRRILSGECTHTVFYCAARDRFYLA